MAETLLGFGGNLGDPAAAIERALGLLTDRGVAIRRRSRLYRTPAWGPVEQPDFINACAIAETDLSPRDLLATCQAIEAELGRRPAERWGPRALDIDILAYGDLVIEEPGLTVPHPRLVERAFVLVPLAEIAPDRVVASRQVRDWLAGVDQGGIEVITGS